MYKLEVHTDARFDIEELWLSDGDTAAKIEIFLEDLADDTFGLGHLLEHGYGKGRTEEFDISKVFEFWNKKKDIWRIKLWPLENLGIKYRIVYAYIPKELTFYILAVAHRDFNYDPKHAITVRLIRAYNDLTE